MDFKQGNNTPYLQVKPARVKVSTKIADLLLCHTKNRYVEQKLDGQRYIIQTDRPSVCGNYHHGLTSRRKSVKGNMVEKHDRVPHISNHTCLPKNSLLDCEVLSSGDIILKELPGVYWDKLMNKTHPHMKWLLKTFNGALPTYPHVRNTVSIMGSAPRTAKIKQQEAGNIWAYAFDLLQYNTFSITNRPQIVRRLGLINSLFFAPPEDGVILMPAWENLTYSQILQLFEIITSRDEKSGERGEGLILKNFHDRYNAPQAWMKVKKDFAADVVFTGQWEEGNEGVTGKMLGLAGKFEIGVYDSYGTLQPIGWISAIMDSEDKLPQRTQEAINGLLAGQIIEAHFNKIQKTNDLIKYPFGISLQHPRFGGLFRRDKNPEECTFEALSELTKK